MHKVTLTFPTHDSLWLFHEQSRAINVAIRLRTNTLTGLFTRDQINNALAEFGAIVLPADLVDSNRPVRQRGETERNVWEQL